MKKKQDGESTGARIDALELQFASGRLSRRAFINGLSGLGVSLAASAVLVTRSLPAHANQVAQRQALKAEYDYIIVGAGSAGSVLANRISASGASVLLIEDGSADIDQAKIAQSESWLFNIGSETDWAYLTVPQAQLENRTITADAGRVLGGSGSINAMFWLRGDTRDYQSWQQLVGGNWSPSNLLRMFQRVETFLPGPGANRGRSGPIKVGRYATSHALGQATLDGASELGIPTVEHNSAAFIDGAGFAEVNILPDGRRSGPAQGYLLPALARPNLTVLSGVRVLELDVTHSSCRGVKVLLDGNVRGFRAGSEVISSGGTFGSPRLLLLSGIGPAAQLRSLGISVKQHLSAVGANLHDHLLLPGLLFSAGPQLPPAPTLGRVASHTFLRTNPTTEAPNLQIMCMQVPFPPGSVADGQGFTILPWVVKPKSRGTLRLSSSDPMAPMVIDPAYLSDSRDLDNMVESFDRAMALGFTSAMRPFVSGIIPPELASLTRAEKVSFIRKNVGSGLHFVGTCAAGRNAQAAVVDREFRVYGLNRLRVVDGSVIPEVTGVNTQASILTLAELAAETMGFGPC
jgi:choline dehydrogenase